MAKFSFPKQHAILTAENPNGSALSAHENAARNRALEADLKARGFVYHAAVGVYTDNQSGKTLRENSFVVENIHPAEAEALGAKYGQNGVVTHLGYHDLVAKVIHPTAGVHKTTTAPYTQVGGAKYQHDINWSKSVGDEPRDDHGRWTK